MKSILNRLFLILSFLCWADYLQAQNHTTTEKLDCVLFETFLKDLIFLDGERLGIADCYGDRASLFGDTTSNTNALTIIFVDNSSKLSHCNCCLEEIKCHTYCKYSKEKQEVSYSLVYQKQKEDIINQYEEFKEVKNNLPIVIREVSENNGVITISSRKKGSAMTTTCFYKKEGNNFILQDYFIGQY